MSTSHLGGNIQPGLDLEEHAGELNAKRVSLVSAATIFVAGSASGGVFVSTASTWLGGGTGTFRANIRGVQFVDQETLMAGENLTNNLIETIQKPVAVSTYSYTVNTSFGSATKANAKSTPGNILTAFCSNANATVRYFQIHNKATAPAGTNVPIMEFPVPAGTANNPGVLMLDNDFFLQNGYYLSLGVGWAISTTNSAFTDSATASEHEIMIGYI
jgi:hypothetical protein